MTTDPPDTPSAFRTQGHVFEEAQQKDVSYFNFTDVKTGYKLCWEFFTFYITVLM